MIDKSNSKKEGFDFDDFSNNTIILKVHLLTLKGRKTNSKYLFMGIELVFPYIAFGICSICSVLLMI